MGTRVVYPSSLPLLPPQRAEHQGLKTLVLDMDNTLICTSFEPPDGGSDFKVRIDEFRSLFVKKRPGLDKFLREMSRDYELVIFTLSPPGYANQVIDQIDPWKKMITHRLFSDSCAKVLEIPGGGGDSGEDDDEEDGFYVKDLHFLGRDLRDVIIVDDCSENFIHNPRNGIQVKEFMENSRDNELEKLGRVLRRACNSQDVRNLDLSHG